MIHFTVYDLLWMFFIYSFLGWLFETVSASLKQKKFANRGLVNGPFCVLYGITAVIITVGLQELTGIWLFLFAMIYATVVEWIAGHLIELAFKERWWDYSNVKWNFDGYVCVPVSVFWGFLGYVIVKWGNKITLKILTILPELLMNVTLLVLVGVMIVDILASYLLLKGKSKNLKKWESANDKIDSVRVKLGTLIYNFVDGRIHKAYPKAQKTENIKVQSKEESETKVFAYGCSFYKIVLLFFIGAFLGDITETIFCRITEGVWMSRSSVLYGPFSIVWGVALAAATMLLYRYRKYSDRFLFFMGTFLGGAYEYTCSVLTEMLFGKVFWDYSKIPFNLGGRINLLYCFFWGIVSVIWLKLCYPFLSRFIEQIPKKTGVIVCRVLVVFMVFDIGMSGLALARYSERQAGNRAVQSRLERYLDQHFPDEKMKEIYPNAKFV